MDDPEDAEDMLNIWKKNMFGFEFFHKYFTDTLLPLIKKKHY